MLYRVQQLSYIIFLFDIFRL